MPFSNTKVKLFVAYAEGVSAFRTIARTSPEPNAISYLKGIDQEKTCMIADAADMCLMLSKGLAKLDEVIIQAGSVTDASWSHVRIHTIETPHKEVIDGGQDKDCRRL